MRLPSAATKFRRLTRRLTEEVDANRRGRSYAVTVMTPIQPDHTQPLQLVLQGFGARDRSPLATLPTLHFGRWVVLHELPSEWPGAPRRTPALKSDYLLFSADVTAPSYQAGTLPESFFRELGNRIPAEAAAVWSHCHGYPGTAQGDAFVGYLASSRVDASLYYAAYPDATVTEIRQALELREALSEFVQRHQGRQDPVALKKAYLGASERWPDSS